MSTRFPGSPQAARTWSGSAPIGDGVKVFVGVQEVPGRGETWAKVEFNPSRVVDPDGHGLAAVRELPGAVEAALRAAGSLVEAGSEVGEMRVKRLDVARDFEGVERPDFYVRGLGPVARPWARLNLVHFDPQRRGAQTLMVGSRTSGVVRLYDKAAETDGVVAEGTLRWEAEARGGWCKQYGEIGVLADVSEESVGQLARDRWEWSAMGVEVCATDRVLEKVQRSGLSPAKQRSFLGHLLLRSRGMESPVGSRAAAEWNRLVRELGITLSGETFGGAGGFVGRLDYDSGREVMRAA